MPRLDLPLPPTSLRVNKVFGKHWGSTYKAKASYAQDCARWFLAQRDNGRMEGPWPVRLDVTIVLGPRQRCDPSDAGTWAKSAFDCLTQLGFWPDDSATYLNPITFLIEKKDRKHPRIVLRW